MADFELEDPRTPVNLAAIVLVVAALALTGLGLLGIYAAEAGGGDGLSQTQRQLAFVFAGLACGWLTARIGHPAFGRFAYALFGCVLIVLALLVIARYVPMAPLFPVRRNAARWVAIGPMQFQPSEFAKLVYVMALAAYLRYRSNYRTLRGLIPPFVLTLTPMALILKEPDLGTAMVFLPVLFVMLFAAGARKRHLVVLGLLGCAAAPIYYYSPIMNDYQRQRVQVLLRQDDPDRRWQMGPGFQLRQSKIAIGSGQWFGQDSDDTAFFRHNMLPEHHNDFIFAVIAHQWGFFGAAALILAYLVLLAAGLVAASSTDEPFARLLAVGLCSLITVQMFINAGMTMGLMPPTGLSLPFVSSGGSGLLANSIAIGLLVSVAQRRPFRLAPKPFEFREQVVYGD